MKTTTVLVLIAVALGACSPKAQKADCEKMVDKMIEVQLQGQSAAVAAMTKSMMQSQKGDMVNDCAGKVTQAQVSCVLAAKTQADIDKCN